MSNNNQLSHDELIEETFLKDATPSDIINWLKDHCGSLDDFFSKILLNIPVLNRLFRI